MDNDLWGVVPPGGLPVRILASLSPPPLVPDMYVRISTRTGGAHILGLLLTALRILADMWFITMFLWDLELLCEVKIAKVHVLTASDRTDNKYRYLPLRTYISALSEARVQT